ncbi:MAG: hypothetical protein AM326_02745 [Candidatus Thorarchaeota archaeon SMTZ-45]|nr:MAG: hypothetical protein AM326_02745 [Candidatus Thorarchaeota archaeon SMTZ-45]
MNADKALANSMPRGSIGGGDTGKGRVERMSFSQLRFTQMLDTGQKILSRRFLIILGLKPKTVLWSST